MQFFLHMYCLMFICFCMVVVKSETQEECDCEQLRTEIKLLKELVFGFKVNEGPRVAHATPALPALQQTWSEYEYTSTYTTTITTPVSTLVPIWIANQHVTTTISGLETVETIVTSTLTSSTLVDVKATKADPLSPTTSKPSLQHAINPTKSMQASVEPTAIEKPIGHKETDAMESGVNKVTRLSLVIGRVRPKLKKKPSSGSRNSFKKFNGLKKSSFGLNGKKSNSFNKFNSFRQRREADDPTNYPVGGEGGGGVGEAEDLTNYPHPRLMSSKEEDVDVFDQNEMFCEVCKQATKTVTVNNCLN